MRDLVKATPKNHPDFPLMEFAYNTIDEVTKKMDVASNAAKTQQMLLDLQTDIKDQYDEKMKNAGKEAHAILESARASAAQEKQQILEEAQHEVSRIKKQAQEDLEREKRNAQKDMKEAISSVAIEAAKKLVKKEMDEAAQKEYIDDFIDEAGSSKW